MHQKFPSEAFYKCLHVFLNKMCSNSGHYRNWITRHQKNGLVYLSSHSGTKTTWQWSSRWILICKVLFHILLRYKSSYAATPVNRFFRSISFIHPSIFWSILLIKVHSVTGAKQYVYVRLQYIQCGYNITKQRIFARRVAWVAAAATTAAPQFAAHGQQSCNGSILADCCASAAPHAAAAAALRQQ